MDFLYIFKCLILYNSLKHVSLCESMGIIHKVWDFCSSECAIIVFSVITPECSPAQEEWSCRGFKPENGGNIFFQNIVAILSDYENCVIT